MSASYEVRDGVAVITLNNPPVNGLGYETRRGDNSRPWLIAGTLLAILAAFAALVINRRLP